ncbi:hypothetical protein BST61_g6758 [Cercospora zeina]
MSRTIHHFVQLPDQTVPRRTYYYYLADDASRCAKELWKAKLASVGTPQRHRLPPTIRHGFSRIRLWFSLLSSGTAARCVFRAEWGCGHGGFGARSQRRRELKDGAPSSG